MTNEDLMLRRLLEAEAEMERRDNRENWGNKITFSVYVEGEFEAELDDDLFKAAEDLDARFDAEFIGVMVEPVEDQPYDQIAT